MCKVVLKNGGAYPPTRIPVRGVATASLRNNSPYGVLKLRMIESVVDVVSVGP